MKYEISQDNYKSYLNGLTYVQQFNRTNNPPQSAVGALALAPAANPSRNSIAIKVQGVPNSKPAVYGCDMNGNGTFDEVGDGGNIACNYLSWPDLMAYLDWSGLRPMSEFEFEKACRGAAPVPNPNENAWSTTTSLQAQSGALSNAGTGTEVSTSSGDGLCAYGAGTNTKGPLRCGFAATSATTRFQAGAGFYGIMELSGNVMEQCVGGYNFNYSAFTSANGDGEIATNGTADMAGWPVDGGGQKGGVGRGGDWFSGSQYLRVSDRAFMVQNVNQVRDGRLAVVACAISDPRPMGIKTAFTILLFGLVATLRAQYGGGVNDGHAEGPLQQADCSSVMLDPFFQGGFSDGSDMGGLSPIELSGPADRYGLRRRYE